MKKQARLLWKMNKSLIIVVIYYKSQKVTSTLVSECCIKGLATLSWA
jgi:hypothetical protein